MPAHVPDARHQFDNDYNGYVYNVRTFVYDLIVFLFNIVLRIFFREIKVRGGYNVPPRGVPTILVCAPHANQFIDPTLVMITTRNLSGKHRARQACFVSAASSLKMKVVGLFARSMGSIPVPRVQDNLKDVDSRIEIYAPDWDNNPRLIKGRVRGAEAMLNFTTMFTEKSLIGLPNYLSNSTIESIIDDSTLMLSSPFKNDKDGLVREMMVHGTNFKYAEKVDNTETFQSVFDHLHSLGCVGIFPEGGSHDRPSLLPIKAGVAIMALGAVAADPTMKVAVVPVGLHYFHRNKFRSRAVIEYGEPIYVHGDQGKLYKEKPRETVSKLLKEVSDALFTLTQNAPDYETLMTIQAARRLFQRSNSRIPLPAVVEIQRRLLVGYKRFQDDERIIHLKNAVQDYNYRLYSMGLKDHQVMNLKTKPLETLRCAVTLLQRIARVTIFFFLSLPGSILFLPIFVGATFYSKKKQREGLKKSSVKIKGIDLLATWKLIVALVMAPSLYITYSINLIILHSRKSKLVSWLWVPSEKKYIQFVYFYAILVFVSYASLKTGEIGFDLFKSLRPLMVSLIYPQDYIQDLQKRRTKLSDEITALCNELGPQVFPDYEKFTKSYLVRKEKDMKSIEHDEVDHLGSPTNLVSNRSRSSSVYSMTSNVSNSLSRVNSRGSLTDIPIFSDSRQNNLSDVTSDEEEIGNSSNKNDVLTSKISSLMMNKRGKKED
ncbi:Glycerol-3-phosphate O-acyltransferase 2 [Nakaseomyces bracarensis]|uniref:Glycerol-3-phosphate O-acyltransferase 2 n=1 Tax=Nakaseomyces bracarensis TaxID=273131 RepID=A0ABR4NY63_9SACH